MNKNKIYHWPKAYNGKGYFRGFLKKGLRKMPSRTYDSRPGFWFEKIHHESECTGKYNCSPIRKSKTFHKHIVS